MCTIDLTVQCAMLRFWVVLVLVACLSLGVTPRPTVVLKDDDGVDDDDIFLLRAVEKEYYDRLSESNRGLAYYETDDDFDGSGKVLIDDDQSLFSDDVWYG